MELQLLAIALLLAGGFTAVLFVLEKINRNIILLIKITDFAEFPEPPDSGESKPVPFRKKA